MPRRPGNSTARYIAQIAGKLFFEEGVQGIHVDRVAMLSDVTKRTVYKHYRSRDLLIAAAVRTPSPLVPSDSEDPPAVRIIGMFDRLAEYISAPGFRGCPFLNASIDFPNTDHPARIAIRDVKEQRRRWLLDRALEAGFENASDLAQQLALIFDGALAASSVRMTREPASTARRLVIRLLNDAGSSLPGDFHVSPTALRLAK